MYSSDLFEQTHQYWWRQASNLQYRFWRVSQPEILEKIEILEKKSTVDSITEDYNRQVKMREMAKLPPFTETLDKYIERVKQINLDKVQELNLTLGFLKSIMESAFRKLNEFREENSMVKLISLGSSPAEDFRR